MLGAHKTKMA